MKLGKAV